MYGHESAICPYKSWADKCEVAEQEEFNKIAKQVNNEPITCLKCKKEGHSSKNCILGINDIEARKKAQIAIMRCYASKEKGHKISGCPNKSASPRSTQMQVSNKQARHVNNKGRICYTCRKKGHLSKDCPMGNIPKSNSSIQYFDMLRKATNGSRTSKVVSSPYTSTRAIWVPKHLLTNLAGPNKGWVPKSAC
jgi:hypothetical protein